MAESTLQKIAPPALPLAPDEYVRAYQDQLNNIQRLFYNRLTTLTNDLASDTIQFVAALPPATAANRGAVAYLENPDGVADLVYICTKDAAGTFSWKLVA